MLTLRDFSLVVHDSVGPLSTLCHPPWVHPPSIAIIWSGETLSYDIGCLTCTSEPQLSRDSRVYSFRSLLFLFPILARTSLPLIVPCVGWISTGSKDSACETVIFLHHTWIIWAETARSFSIFSASSRILWGEQKTRTQHQEALMRDGQRQPHNPGCCWSTRE